MKNKDTFIISKNKKVITSKETENKQIKNLIMYEGLEKIGNGTFKGQKLEKLKTPNSLQVIGAYAFHENALLSNLELNEGLFWIGASAFEGCNLSSITIPKSVNIIGNYAFSNNPLEEVTIDHYSTISLLYDYELYNLFGSKVKIKRKELVKK